MYCKRISRHMNDVLNHCSCSMRIGIDALVNENVCTSTTIT